MESPNATANSSTGCEDSIAPWLVKPKSPCNRPSWNTSTSSPNAALRVSRFITSAFTGSTTERVITKRIISVVAHNSANAYGRCARSDRC